MQKWEYMVFSPKPDKHMVQALNDLGQQGWEAVGVTWVGGTGQATNKWGFMFKRPIPE